jgi:single-strand DNA-binding protein
MVQGLNKVMVIGYLGRDPEMRFTPNGKSVSNFCVACSRTWQGADGNKHTDTDWFNVVAWGNLAELAKQNLRKGNLVYIEGRLQTRTWQDTQGKKHKSVEIIARELLLLNETQKEKTFEEDDCENYQDELS